MPMFRKPIWIAWLICFIACAWALFALAETVINYTPDGRAFKLAGDILTALHPLLFVIPTTLIILHQPRNTIGWLLMITTLVAVLADVFQRYLMTFQAAPPPATLPILVMAWFVNIAWVGAIFPLLIFPQIFPTGRPLTPRWRWGLYLGIGMALFFISLSPFQQPFYLEPIPWTLHNPIGFITDEYMQYFMPIWAVLLLALTVTSLVSMVVRYRRASAVERQQLKWLLYACTLFALVYIFLIPTNTNRTPPQFLEDISHMLINLAVAAIPAATAIAILRYHLFDIDVIIRLTLIYTLLTGLLGLCFAGGVILLQTAFRLLTGQASDAAVVITTLVIAALFTPLRLRIQRIIDRRFFRQKYSVEQAIAEFTTAARSGSDLETLTVMLESVVQANLQPTQVSLHLKTMKDSQG